MATAKLFASGNTRLILGVLAGSLQRAREVGRGLDDLWAAQAAAADHKRLLGEHERSRNALGKQAGLLGQAVHRGRTGIHLVRHGKPQARNLARRCAEAFLRNAVQLRGLHAGHEEWPLLVVDGLPQRGVLPPVNTLLLHGRGNGDVDGGLAQRERQDGGRVPDVFSQDNHGVGGACFAQGRAGARALPQRFQHLAHESKARVACRGKEALRAHQLAEREVRLQRRARGPDPYQAAALRPLPPPGQKPRPDQLP